MKKLFQLLLFVWMAAMFGLGIWSLVPPPRSVVKLPLQPLRFSDGREVVLANRSLRLDLPAYLRVGEGQDARFEITAGQLPAELILIATARLQLPVLAGEPAEAHLRLVDGQAARFTWRLLARQVELQRGVLWLTVAAQETGRPLEEIALLARPVEIAVRSELPLRIGVGMGLALGCFGWIFAGRYRR